MSRLNLRKRKRVCYYEPEEPPFDEYIFCTKCRDYVYEYCSIHGPLLVIPDDKVPSPTGYPPEVPRAALTVPSVFLHLAKSRIPDAGIGVFSTLTLPSGVQFGPYRGTRLPPGPGSYYGWQIVDANHKPSHIVDACDPETSNWMRYVNCSRHYSEQNLVAYQYKGELYYRTVRVIPRFTELLVFYGAAYARELGVDLRRYRAVVPPPTDPACDCPHCQSPEPEKPASASIKTRKRKVQTTDKPVAEKIAKTSPVEKQQQAPDKTSVNTQRKDDASSESTIQPIFNTPNAPFNETNEVHLPPKIDFTCDKCRENFESKTDLEKHVHTHSSGIKKTDVSTSNAKTKCDKCNVSFDTNADLVKHLYTHMVKNPTDKYTCKFCNTKFGTNMCLMEHMERQHNVKWLTCYECDYRTIVESCLVQHQKTHAGETGIRKQAHTGIVFKCGSCNYTSSNKSHLIEHKLTHTEEKAFKCDICEFKTMQSSTLKQHLMSVHAGVKPFKCSYCSYACSQKGNLVKHERTHTGEKLFKCSYCSYACSQKGNLVSHERTHTGEKLFKCSYCSYACSRKGNLVLHERTHTGEKPFKCSYCNYSCSQKYHLVSHERTHTGEKPYKCDICEYKAARSSSLKVHLMSEHAGVSKTFQM